MEEVSIKFFKMYKDVRLPERLHDWDSCWDVYSNVEMSIAPGETRLVPTGLKVGLEKGWELLVRPRSSLAAYHGITVLNTPGTIDAGYRNEIGVVLHNTSNKTFFFDESTRIAQLALKPVYDMKIVEVETEAELGESERGLGGFGSTG